MSQNTAAGPSEDFDPRPFEFRGKEKKGRERRRKRSRGRSEPEVEVVASAPVQKSLVDRLAEFVMSLLRDLEATISSVGK